MKEFLLAASLNVLLRKKTKVIYFNSQFLNSQSLNSSLKFKICQAKFFHFLTHFHKVTAYNFGVSVCLLVLNVFWMTWKQHVSLDSVMVSRLLKKRGVIKTNGLLRGTQIYSEALWSLSKHILKVVFNTAMLHSLQWN